MEKYKKILEDIEKFDSQNKTPKQLENWIFDVQNRVKKVNAIPEQEMLVRVGSASKEGQVSAMKVVEHDSEEKVNNANVKVVSFRPHPGYKKVIQNASEKEIFSNCFGMISDSELKLSSNGSKVFTSTLKDIKYLCMMTRRQKVMKWLLFITGVIFSGLLLSSFFEVIPSNLVLDIVYLLGSIFLIFIAVTKDLYAHYIKVSLKNGLTKKVRVSDWKKTEAREFISAFKKFKTELRA